MTRDNKLNSIMIQLAVLEEKIDRINTGLEKVDELEKKVSELETFRAYTKGAAFVSIAGISAIVGTALQYLENLWG